MDLVSKDALLKKEVVVKMGPVLSEKHSLDSCKRHLAFQSDREYWRRGKFGCSEVNSLLILIFYRELVKDFQVCSSGLRRNNRTSIELGLFILL